MEPITDADLDAARTEAAWWNVTLACAKCVKQVWARDAQAARIKADLRWPGLGGMSARKASPRKPNIYRVKEERPNTLFLT